ncbi:MAG: Smr/MutS family protein [Alphaproteobacteria bacterium]
MARKPTDDERALWQQMIKDVVPLTHKAVVVSKGPVNMASVHKKIVERQYKELYANIAAPPEKGRGQGAAESKLMPTGKVQLEGRIDLHGMTLAQAEDHLKRYLLHAQLNNKRWILVITGKGAPDNPDSLRRAVPLWLNQWTVIAGYRVAKPHDGGEGALYVWIKKLV